MRQAGVLAAAGLYALEHHVARLAEDHANAVFLADRLRAAGLSVDTPQTNMVYLSLPPAQVAPLAAHLALHGVVASIGERTRLVTHLDLSRNALARVADLITGHFGRV